MDLPTLSLKTLFVTNGFVRPKILPGTTNREEIKQFIRNQTAAGEKENSSSSQKPVQAGITLEAVSSFSNRWLTPVFLSTSTHLSCVQRQVIKAGLTGAERRDMG